MKHIMNNRGKCSILAIVLIISITIVAATPPIPESYWGYATLNGAPAAYGTSITVEVYGTGEVVGSTTVQYPDGGYSLDVKFDDPDTGEDEGANDGDKLTWKINSIECSTPAPGADTATPGGTNSNFNLIAISATNPPSVTVLYPNGGESIPIGTQVQVSAHATDDNAVTSVTFYYSNDSNWNFIEAGTRVSGTFKAGIWNITWNTKGLSASSNYKIKAVASDGTLTGEDHSDSTFSLTCTPPSPPALNDPGTIDTDGDYTVSWSSVSGATSYTLEEDTSSSFSSPTVVHSGAGTSKYITGKSDGTYYYRVKACNACGCSGWSNVEDITVEIGTVITVDDSGRADYTTIQEAVNNAGSGYTIKVFSGNYSEHVVIDKSLKLIGENKDTTIVVGGGNGSCAHITADNVEISGFTIMNCFEGVYVESSKGIIIDNNIISDNFDGIYLVNSDSNTITHNVITNNIWYVCGIHLTSSSNNTISDNDIAGNDKGVYLYNSINNLIYHNNFIDSIFKQAYDNTGTNSWDKGPTEGGNYWSDHGCIGNPSAGSQPYYIDTDGVDHYPFQESNGWVKGNQPPVNPVLTSDKPEPQTAGNAITWTASATDPEGDTLYYRFWLRGPATENSWQIMQDWSTDNTWTWYTSSADIGDTDISVWIRDGHHAPSDRYDLERIYYDYTIESSQTSVKKPDLVITHIEDSDVVGETRIVYTIKNQGNAEAGPSYTGLYIDGTYIEKNYVWSLAPGASIFRTFDYTLDCTAGEKAEIKVCADIGYQVVESDEANNCRTESLTCPSAILEGNIIYHADYGEGIWRMHPDGTGRTQLSGHGWFTEYSPDNAKIAFGEFYQNGIYVMNADGTNQIKLTRSGNAPTWSTDGKQIAYHDGNTADKNRRIWVMNADGTNVHQLSENPGSFPKWSPNGNKIVYHGEVNNGIWLINSDGTGETLLYKSGGYPAWSPDGKKIVYSSLTDGCIWTMNADGTGKTKLTDHKGIHPTWSSDGTKIAYEYLAKNKGIRVINADGSGDHMINEEGHAPDWSNENQQ